MLTEPEAMKTSEEAGEAVETCEDDAELARKLEEMLNTYPGISLSMMYCVMGQNGSRWRPAFERMLSVGQIVKIAIMFGGSDEALKLGGKTKLREKYFNAADLEMYTPILEHHHKLTVLTK